MSIVKRILCVGTIFLALLLLSSCSPKEAPQTLDRSTAPKPAYHDPVFGTWTAPDSNPQKVVLHSGWKFECFAKSGDIKPVTEGTFAIVERTADNNGNILYKINVTNSMPSASASHALWRLSLDGSKLELVDVPVKSFAQGTWPSGVDRNDATYRRYLPEK